MEEAGVEGALGRRLGRIHDPRGGSTAMFMLHAHETKEKFAEADSRGVREWFPLGVAGTAGCAASLDKLERALHTKHVHQHTLLLLREALPSIASEAEAEELAAAGRAPGTATAPEPKGARKRG